MPHRNISRTRTKIRIVKRHVIHKDVLHKSLPIPGCVSDLTHRCRTTHKTICKGNDARRALGFLLANLQRVFICHTTRIRHKTMSQSTRPTCLRCQDFSDLKDVNIMLKMSLHTHIRESALECSFDHTRIGMPKHIHADSVDHVPLHAAVGELHKCTISNASTNVWIHRGTAAQFVIAFQPRSVRFDLGSIRWPSASDRSLRTPQFCEDRVDCTSNCWNRCQMWKMRQPMRCVRGMR